MQKLSMSPTKNKLHHRIEHTIEKGIRMALGIRHYTCHLDVLKCALSTNISMGQNEEFLLYMLSNSFIVKKKTIRRQKICHNFMYVFFMYTCLFVRIF